MFQFDGNLAAFRFMVCLAIILFSLVFYAFDTRTKYMIKWAEELFIKLEIQYAEQYGNDIMLFTQAEEKTMNMRKERLIYKLLSYSILLRIVYAFFALIGIIGIILTILQITGSIDFNMVVLPK